MTKLRVLVLSFPDFTDISMWCSQSGNHPENHLAKVGYIQDLKVEKK
jgi:hypothetical protein